ncbi:MAG: hypothetical protein JWM16_1750 [Verrucomicrobiales bacterium]|nr:hypothetical protein [Verrucomicrobiales bacterium]
MGHGAVNAKRGKVRGRHKAEETGSGKDLPKHDFGRGGGRGSSVIGSREYPPPGRVVLLGRHR